MLDNTLDDREPKPRSWHRTSGVRSMEPVEDQRQVFFGNTWPTVKDRQRSPFDNDIDLPVGLVEFACVVDQVRDRSIKRRAGRIDSRRSTHIDDDRS